jgi:hypothetical protein
MTTVVGKPESLYAERPEWNDVTPLSQYENVNPLAPILYSAECMYENEHDVCYDCKLI